MPTEDELREQFHESTSGADSRIDLDAVLRRARRRRAPRVAAVAIVSSLAVVGIVVPVSISVASGQTGMSSAGSAGSAASAASAPDLSAGRAPESANGSGGDSTINRAPAERINLCAGTLAAPAPADNGLALIVSPVDAAADARGIPVTVTLTNTGAQRVTGSLSPFPTLTLSREGIVLWHSNGAVPALAQEIDLPPGASTTFSTTFEPVVCGVEDDAQPSFRAKLPEAGPGEYRLSAALDFTPSNSEPAVLVTGPTAAVVLH